jgi:predicted dinucleotide-binding enzyme
LLPGGARLVKALSDDADIKEQIEGLVQAVGFEPLRIGGINQSIRIEAFGDLAEYGALGKTVTLTEAKAIV